MFACARAASFKSREDHRKQIELEEARKAGLAPAEVDEDGKEINPHIPQYMSSAPWYLNADKPVRMPDRRLARPELSSCVLHLHAEFGSRLLVFMV